MCGIAGTINLNPDPDAIINALRHRGPNACGVFSFENIHLFHTRLSIQDLRDSANQPMEYEHFVIVFNGEIYNHKNLRQKLPHHVFKTQSDTETILVLFAAFGEQIFHEFDGMFACVILDKKQRKLIFARDKMGKKPLFCYHNGQHFAFASELLTLARCVPLQIDTQHLSFFLRFGFFLHDGAPYSHVFAFPHAHYGTIVLDKMEQGLQNQAYFDLYSLYTQPKITVCEKGIEEVKHVLNVSIKRRLESSSIEVGSFLSGGIDSPLIVAIAASHCKQLKTFTVAFEGAYDESPLAELVAHRYGTQHHVLSINTSNLRDDIEKILFAYGRPFMDSSAIPSYYVSKEAKKHVSVILNGDGADELFGGYRRYVPFANGWLHYASKMRFLLKILPKSHHQKSIYNYIYRLLAMSYKQGADLYASATIDSFEDIYQFETNAHTQSLDKLICSVTNDNNLSPLSKMLYLDSQLLLLCDLLPKMDIATMQHALEARSPFLGTDVLAVSTRLSDNLKIKSRITKFVLRELAKSYLPDELIYAKKRGFEVPLAHWVDVELKDLIHERLNHCVIISELINQDFMKQLLNNPQKFPTQKRAKMLFTLFSLAVWFEHFNKINIQGSL